MPGEDLEEETCLLVGLEAGEGVIQKFLDYCVCFQAYGDEELGVMKMPSGRAS